MSAGHVQRVQRVQFSKAENQKEKLWLEEEEPGWQVGGDVGPPGESVPAWPSLPWEGQLKTPKWC